MKNILLICAVLGVWCAWFEGILFCQKKYAIVCGFLFIAGFKSGKEYVFIIYWSCQSKIFSISKLIFQFTDRQIIHILMDSKSIAGIYLSFSHVSRFFKIFISLHETTQPN